MTEESRPRVTLREWVLAALLCMTGALVVLWEPLVGDASTLSFDERHPAYPAPWARPDGGARPPINPITPDGDFLVLPGLMRIAQLEEAGRDPWWDDRQLVGYPLGANQAWPLFLPYARWLVGADPVDVLDGLLGFHMALAAFGAWRAVRLLGGGRLPGALAAVGFALCTWMVTRWHLPQITYTTACWPGLVVAVEWLRRRRWRTAVAEGGFWIGFGLVAGFPQVGMIFLAGFVFLVVLDRTLWRPAPLVAAALACVVGLGLAAPLLNSVRSVYPTAARTSPRSMAFTADSGLQPAALMGAVLPEFFGSPPDFATRDPPAPSMEAWLPRRLLLRPDVQNNPVEDAFYPGVLVLLLAPLAWRRGVDRRASQLVAAGALSVLGALAIPLVIDLVPGLEALGAANTKRVIVLWAGCLPLGAALVLDAMLRRATRPSLVPGLVLAAIAAVALLVVAGLDDPDADAFLADLAGQSTRLVVLVVAGTALLVAAARGARWAAGLAVLVLFADLVTLAWAFNPFPPQVEPFGPRDSLAWLAQRPGRVAVVGARRTLPPSGAALHGIRSLHGNVPMLDLRTAELLACMGDDLVDWRDPRSVEPFPDASRLDHSLLDLLEVSTVVHADPGMAARRGEPNLYENVDEGLAAFGREGAGPRAFLCGGARVVTDDEERLAWLSRPDAPVFTTVLLEEDPGFPLPESGPMLPLVPQVDAPGRIALEFDAPFDGVVVVPESWHAGWGAWRDGRRVTLRPVDHALLGVPVRAGRHRLEFAHDLHHQRAARAIQAVAAAVLLACLVRRPAPHPASG